jgi:hypothetical protein
MTSDEQTLLMIKGLVSEQPPEARVQIEAFADDLRKAITEPNGLKMLAFILVGAEFQAKS